MRVLELTAHVQTLRRSRGQSATAAAAYRSCTRIACRKTGIVHDYRRKGGLETAGLIAPAAWATDRGELWNAAELKERNGPRGPNANAFRAAAVVAREFMFGYPAELSEAGRLAVAQRVAAHLVERYGVAADYAVHRPGSAGDERNFHCHMLVTSRRVEADGLGVKTRELDAHANGSREIKAFRAFLAATLNSALADEGKDKLVFVEHRSFKDRGSSQRATRHQGKGVTNARRKDQQQAREAWLASERTRQTERQAKDRTALSARHADASATGDRDRAAREARGIAAIRAEQAQAQAADRAPTGAGRFAQLITGQAGRADQARADRAAQRIEAAEAKIAELKAVIRSERRSMAEAQAKESRALSDHHVGEERQLDRALASRIVADRVAEVQARRDDARQIGQERDHSRDQSGRDGPLRS